MWKSRINYPEGIGFALRLSEATVDLPVMEHKIRREKVGAGEELKGPQSRSKPSRKDAVLPTRKNSPPPPQASPTEIGSCCEISPKPCSGLCGETGLQGQAAAIKNLI